MTRSLAPQSNPARTSPPKIGWVTLGLLHLAALAVVAHNWGVVYLWRTETLPRDRSAWLEVVHPGFEAMVTWIQARGVSRIRSLPYASDPARYQRLMEMLYPIELEPVAASGLTSGDLLVVGAGVQLALPVERLFATSALAVVQVR